MQTETHTHTLAYTEGFLWIHTTIHSFTHTQSPSSSSLSGPNSESNQGLLELHMEEDTIERKRDVRGGDVRTEDGT